MDSCSLRQIAEDQLAAATGSSAGRSAKTVHGGRTHTLRQTLIALAAGNGLDDHESPGDATLQVLRGKVTVSDGEQTWEGSAGDFLVIPDRRHDLRAIEDSAILLSVGLAGVPQD